MKKTQETGQKLVATLAEQGEETQLKWGGGMGTNFKQLYAKKKYYEQKLIELCPSLKHESGIYFWTRVDENGVGFYYIGQSVDCIERNVSHCMGYSQHIDLSIRSRGFYSESNLYGWKLNVLYYPESKLDEMEQHWILEYMKKGYQARYNKTSGSQGEGKEKINEYRPAKGYRDGVRYGEIKLAREIKAIIDKHLIVTIKEEKKDNKISQRALDKFYELLNMDSYKEE